MQTLEHQLELFGQSLKVLVFFAVVVIPATWVCVRRLVELPLTARLMLGAAAGFSLFVVGAQYLGAWSLDALVLYWVAQVVVAAWLGKQRLGEMAPAPAVSAGVVEKQIARATGTTMLTSLVIAAGVALQFYALSCSELPAGVDSAFHCVVAQRQLDAGRATTDLWPLEELRLNYPIGSHLWVAVASRWTGLAVHEVFRHSFVIALIGSSLCVAAWSERLFETPAHGLAGAFAFIFGSFQASLFPYTWGGLPSALALWQAFAGLFALNFAGGKRGIFWAMLLWGGVALTHHHTMVASLGGMGLVALWQLARGERSEAAVRMWLALAGAGLVAAGYVLPLALRTTHVNETGVLTYAEEFSWPWEHVWSWGPGLVVVAVAGLLVRAKSDNQAARNSLVALGAVWLAAFVALDYGGRLTTRWLHRPEATPFTPSRFMLDFQFVLAIFGGAGLVAIWRALRAAPLRGLLVTAMAGWAVWQIAPRWSPVNADPLLPIGRWAAANLPPDALISGSASTWVTYIFHRESTSLFVPISEPGGGPRRRLKMDLLTDPGFESWELWRERLGKPIFAVGRASETSWGSPPIHTNRQFGIFELTPDGPVSRSAAPDAVGSSSVYSP